MQERHVSGGTVTPGQKSLILLIVALTVGSVIYRLIVLHHLEQSSLMFIGVPAVLAVLLTLAPPAQSVPGGIVKGISIFLLMAGIFLGEGVICVLMASPIFLFVGLVVGTVMEHYKKKSRKATLGCCLLVLLPMSLEGTTADLSFNRMDRASATAVVEGTPEEVRARMAESPRLSGALPVYLRMGFPRPTSAVGERLEVGAVRDVHFAGGEGMPEDMEFAVEAAGPGFVRFRVVKDGCNMMHTVSHWVGLREANVSWEAVDAGHTRVRWEIAYERRLDPAWYFGPWERYAGRVAARYLIDANAGPR